jgi:hypothetical protein
MNKEQKTSAQDVSWENPSTGKTQQSLLEKICIMNPEYNHKPRLQPANPTRSDLDKAPSSDLTKPNPDNLKQCARSRMISPELQNDNVTMSEETLLLIDLQIQ